MLIGMSKNRKITSETAKKTLERRYLPDFGCLFLSDGLNLTETGRCLISKRENEIFPA